jgi:ABC-2 type transport system ATP-binding protein
MVATLVVHDGRHTDECRAVIRSTPGPLTRRDSMTTSAIEAEGLVKTFGKVRALDGVDMVAREGTVFGLLGPNGAGKTTAIRILSTLLRPDAGRASVGGFDGVREPAKVRGLIG